MSAPPVLFGDLSKFRKFLLLTSMTFLTGVFLAWAATHVMRIEVVKRAAARMNMPILTKLYDGPRMPVSIVAVDDEDLKALGLTWPLHMDYYGRLIETLARYEPQAIFLDVSFLDERPKAEVQALTEALCNVASLPRRVPIFIASLRASGIESPTEDFLAGAKVKRRRDRDFDPQGVSTGEGERYAQEVECVTRVAANLKFDAIDRILWEYPLWTEAIEREGVAGAPFVPSPAVAMACIGNKLDLEASREICHWDQEPASPDEAKKKAEEALMALTWPARASVINEQLSLRLDEKGRAGFSCRADVRLWEYFPFLPALVPKIPFIAKLFPEKFPLSKPCPYSVVVPVRALNGIGMSERELAEQLHEKFLMVGTDLQSSGDTINTPAQGALAGIHGHAIALDNLLRFRGEYRHGGDFELSHPFSRVSLFTFVIIALGSMAVSAWHVWLRPGLPRRPLHAPFDELIDGRAPDLAMGSLREPSLFGMRLLSFAKIFGLHLISFGKFPAGRTGRRWQVSVAFWLGLALLALLTMWLVYALGDQVFHVGPLSMIEYMFVPPFLEFFETGERLSIRVVAAWGASRYVHSGEWFRKALAHHED